MNNKVTILLLFAFAAHYSAFSQQETYTVEKAPFSSDKYNEFCPVFYRNGIVFCTDRNSNPLVNYSLSNGKTPFKINYIDTTGKVTWRKAKLFSKSLKSKSNDGPVTFNSIGDTIYFSRNLITEGKLKEISSSRNRLGIFTAVLDGNKWTKVRDMRFNNEWYSISTPWLTSDGKRLYFASDKPEGYGGSDLYYSDWKGDYWNDPVNLGPVINTEKNESYPFVNPAGELFFSSDGHLGLGGKDIFFSRLKDNEWLTPVRLDPPVNSRYDDFGIVTDTLISEGYFSSNRDKSLDIYRFRTLIPQIFYTDIQKENQYCFRFIDSGAIKIDTLNLRYIWDFGDGKKASGAEVKHCYPGPGKYKVKLDIIDRSTGKLFFSKLAYTLDLKDFVQSYINSPDVAVAGEPVDFDGLKSYLPGYEVISYTWDFGDSSRLMGESLKYIFKKAGEFNVNLGVKLKSLATGVIHNTGVTKKMIVYNTLKERASYLTKKSSEKPVFPDVRKYENAIINKEYSAEEEFINDALFQIRLMTSKSRVNVNSSQLKNLPSKYNLKEVFDQDAGTYNYVADEHLQLMEAYPSFRELTVLGFKDTEIILTVIKDPVEKELYNLKVNYGVLSDDYFDAYGRLKSSAYLMLDQIVILMNRNPGIRIEAGVHTDNLEQAVDNLTISQTRAQLMVNYLINRGISSNRLSASGYGNTKPVASNIYERDRRQNRRVDFRIIK